MKGAIVKGTLQVQKQITHSFQCLTCCNYSPQTDKINLDGSCPKPTCFQTQGLKGQHWYTPIWSTSYQVQVHEKDNSLKQFCSLDSFGKKIVDYKKK